MKSATWKVARAGKLVLALGAIVGVLLFASLPLFSQGSNGRILGTVTDQTGGVISGATVTIRDKDRGVAATLTTDQAGEYNAPSLLPGTYIVSVEANGFKKLDRENVELGVGKEIRVDLTVQPGTQTQTVTVTEAVPLVETTNATLGGSLTGTEVTDLPLNGRNYQNLMGLRPGVMLQPGGSPWTQSTNNVRPDENAWMVEGVLNANGFDSRPVAGASSAITDGANILPVDAIQEFNLEENPKAEYGGKPGALVNVGIKSGTNNLHGSGYAFGREDGWDARNVFNPAPKPVLPVQLEQFGASIGGPIKKDKLFFFANYEGLRDSIANAIGTSVPETGYTLNSKGAPDTTNSMVAAIIALQNAALPVSPLSKTLFGCPSGNLTSASTCTGGVIQGASPTNTSYLSTFPNINTSDNGIAKIDYRINNQHQINGMVYRSTYRATGEDFPMVNSAWVMSFPEVAWTATGNWIWTASSTVVNEFRTGYTSSQSCLCLLDTAAPNGTGWPINTGVTSLGGFPSVTISGFGAQLGSRRGRPMQQGPSPYHDFQDNLSYLRGKHSLKFGVEYAHIEADVDAHDTRGVISFVKGTDAALAGATALEDFFAGLPGSASVLVGNPAISTISNVIGVFAQDDWRLTPKLIVNLGLRWEYRSPLHELNNNVANFDPSSPTGLVQQGQASVGSTLWKPDYKNWSPRLGFAYDVSGKGTTVVRGGGSILYSMFSLAPFTGNPGITNTRNTSIGTIPTGGCNMVVPVGQTCSGVGGSTFGGTITTGSALIPGANLNWDPAIGGGLNGGTVYPTGGTVSCTATQPCSLGAVDPNMKTPFVYDWNLGVTHAFTSNLSLEVQYVGTHGDNLITSVDLNQAAPGAAFCVNASLTAAQLFGADGLPAGCPGGVPIPASVAASKGLTRMREAEPYFAQFPYLQNINFAGNYAHSYYNSLQATLIQRLSHGFNLTAGYTFGHALDNGSLNRFGAQPQNSTDTAAEYGSSDFDVRHRLTATASYNVPGMRGYAQLLEGWRLNTIVTVASAQPWNIYDTGDNFSGTLENTDRWDFFGNPSDFKDSASSIPFCSFPNAPSTGVTSANIGGASCSTTSGVSGITTALSSSLAAKCLANSPDLSTLAVAGCYVAGNSVMTPAKLGTFGTMGRNIFRDNGFKNVDFSIFKNFTFKERFTAQFRVEFFNFFNHPNISNPFGSVNGGGVGFDPSGGSTFGCGCLTPDNAAGNPIVGSGDAREMQLGLKLTF